MADEVAVHSPHRQLNEAGLRGERLNVLGFEVEVITHQRTLDDDLLDAGGAEQDRVRGHLQIGAHLGRQALRGNQRGKQYIGSAEAPRPGLALPPSQASPANMTRISSSANESKSLSSVKRHLPSPSLRGEIDEARQMGLRFMDVYELRGAPSLNPGCRVNLSPVNGARPPTPNRGQTAVPIEAVIPDHSVNRACTPFPAGCGWPARTPCRSRAGSGTAQRSRASRYR